MKRQIEKFLDLKMWFILTARGPGSQKAIHAWLASNGINIPIENITGFRTKLWKTLKLNGC